MIVSFEEFNRKVKDFVDYKKKLLSVIDDFMLWNDDLRKKYKIDNYIESFDFDVRENDEKRYLILQYIHSGFNDIHKYQRQTAFSKKEYEELRKFMENPELYKSVKKYNL